MLDENSDGVRVCTISSPYYTQVGAREHGRPSLLGRNGSRDDHGGRVGQNVGKVSTSATTAPAEALAA